MFSRIIRASLVVVAAAASGMMPARAEKADEVKVAINNVVSDVVFHLAAERGFFAEQNLNVTLISFDSGPKMIAPLGAGQIDVGAGASSAGLYNAVARGINVKVVADKGSTPRSYDYMPLLVRKALVDNGSVKTVADLKGMKFGEVGPGAATNAKLSHILGSAGLAYKDVTHNYINYPQQIAAFTTGAIDAAITTEPSVTQAINSGVAVKFVADGYPDQQVAVLLYGGDFIAKRPAVAERFMIAYLKAARVYNDATAGGKFTGKGADKVIQTIMKSTGLKDPDLFQKMVPNGIDPDGKVNVKSMADDLKFFADNGYLERPAKVEDVVDSSFAEKAVQKLGSYKPVEN
ncbi:ABC transporter substrate-binding protein [Bradyrhizobium sp. Arg237L]|uniref:ABC transporter substrate-binding protein n=1 Tax=Bradyrhizobium sp. Arg237L TaxID=3003352 RepID=UPI00249EE63A|nr:ABC transporter substrate-binding protein [Bradyrhizobium sp. Arg237L]MDI4232600.1 ABC transporter substrate-binding protein [Bradyrhizobium sp. Arg237L]